MLSLVDIVWLYLIGLPSNVIPDSFSLPPNTSIESSFCISLFVVTVEFISL